jgi:hypothetical protein
MVDKTLQSSVLSDGDHIVEDGHDYLIRIYPAEPDPKWGPQVKVTVTALNDHGDIVDINHVTTDDEPSAIKDEIDDLIFDLAAYWREKQEREEDAINDADRAVQEKRHLGG